LTINVRDLLNVSGTFLLILDLWSLVRLTNRLLFGFIEHLRSEGFLSRLLVLVDGTKIGKVY